MNTESVNYSAQVNQWHAIANSTSVIRWPTTWLQPPAVSEDDVRRIFKEELAAIFDTLLGGKG